MKRILVLLLITSGLFLSGCRFVVQMDAREDQIATLSAAIVSGTSTAMALLGPPTEVIAPNTATPFPSETLPPTDVPPTITLTPTVTLTATRAAEDPVSYLGNSNDQYTFDDAHHWAPYQGDNTRAEIRDGAFYYTMNNPTGFSVWTTSATALRNFYIEVEITNPAVCSGTDNGGLVFRSPNPSQGYLFAFSCDGKYRLIVSDDIGFNAFFNWEQHYAINVGGGAINRMGVLAEGNTISLYANGTKINGFDLTQFDSGKFGFHVTANDTTGYTLKFDNLRYWILP